VLSREEVVHMVINSKGFVCVLIQEYTNGEEKEDREVWERVSK